MRSVRVCLESFWVRAGCARVEALAIVCGGAIGWAIIVISRLKILLSPRKTLEKRRDVDYTIRV